MPSRLPIAAALAFLLAAPAAALAARSTGFEIPAARELDSPKVVCATNLPLRGLTGLYCASRVIRKGAYDHEGVVRITSAGTVAVVPSANDLLLAIDGNLDSTAPRRTLRPGQSWRADGYRCRNRVGVVRCWRGRHGFTVRTRLRVF